MGGLKPAHFLLTDDFKIEIITSIKAI